MRSFIFILLGLSAGQALAQDRGPQPETFRKKPLYITKEPFVNVVDSLSPDKPDLLKRLTEGDWLAQGRKSHNTSLGTVYIMPLDNMPCLVPDARKTSKMPTMRVYPHNKMPNAFTWKSKARR